MRISLYVPSGRKGVVDLLSREIALSKNIKDRKYGQQIYFGLNKLLQNFISSGDSKVYFYDIDDDAFAVFPYVGKDFVYRIDKDFVTAPLDKLHLKSKYLLVLLDANECTIGELNGKKINVLWSDTSNVPKKMGKGGQSSVRFAQNRELALLAWKKKIADVLKRIYYDGGVK